MKADAQMRAIKAQIAREPAIAKSCNAESTSLSVEDACS